MLADGRPDTGGRWVPLGRRVVVGLAVGIGLHEIVLTAIGDAGLGERTDILRYTWVVPGLILALVVGASLLYLARAIPKGIRRQLVFAAVVFLTGAVGFEALSGRLELTRGQDRWFVLAGSIEEILEMLGVLIALHAVVGPVLARRSPDRLDLQVPSSLRTGS